MRVVRAFYPPMIIIGFLISLLVYVNVEEKIVQAKRTLSALSLWMR